MSENTVKLGRISWQEVLPWTSIFKTLNVAASPTIVCIALLGTLLNPVGWRVSETLFLGSDQQENREPMEIAALNASPYRGLFPDTNPAKGINILGVPINGPRLIFDQMLRRFGLMFNPSHQGREFWYFLTGNLWSILVWSFVGLAISRVCLIRMTRNEYAGLDEAFRFALRHWTAAGGAILLPLTGVALLCIPAAIMGWMMGFDWGVMLVGLAWIVVLLISLVMVFLLLGVAVGWPLMVVSVAAEGQSSFDAMTRAYAYVMQRPIHFVFYGLLAILFGGLCWMLAALIADGVVQMAYWAVSWGTAAFGSERIGIIQADASAGQGISRTLDYGGKMIGGWNAFVRTIAAAFIYGLFWCQASVIYLLLRKNVDDTEMDEIYIEEEARTFERPQLKVNESGIPQVQPLEED
jgi:hypothetical protein